MEVEAPDLQASLDASAPAQRDPPVSIGIPRHANPGRVGLVTAPDTLHIQAIGRGLMSVGRVALSIVVPTQ